MRSVPSVLPSSAIMISKDLVMPERVLAVVTTVSWIRFASL